MFPAHRVEHRPPAFSYRDRSIPLGVRMAPRKAERQQLSDPYLPSHAASNRALTKSSRVLDIAL